MQLFITGVSGFVGGAAAQGSWVWELPPKKSTDPEHPEDSPLSPLSAESAESGADGEGNIPSTASEEADTNA